MLQRKKNEQNQKTLKVISYFVLICPSGKTLAYGIPVVQFLQAMQPKVKARQPECLKQRTQHQDFTD